MNHNDFLDIPDNIFTLVDLLEDKGISWAEYEEDMPIAGYQRKHSINPRSKAVMYVREHNPAILYAANAKEADRRAKIKPMTMLKDDLDKNTLPQWMFITPNMTNCGHDTTVTTAGRWTRNFIAPLLKNPSFMNRTLILITFDENDSYAKKNHVVAILLGDTIPAKLIGTTDTAYYNHYSGLATVEANWNLHTLGSWDVGANVFGVVAEKTGNAIRKWSGKVKFEDMYFNTSYAGRLSKSRADLEWPIPNTEAVYAGRSNLPAVMKKRGHRWGTRPIRLDWRFRMECIPTVS